VTPEQEVAVAVRRCIVANRALGRFGYQGRRPGIKYRDLLYDCRRATDELGRAVNRLAAARAQEEEPDATATAQTTQASRQSSSARTAYPSRAPRGDLASAPWRPTRHRYRRGNW
jgi:hypothetical protein